MNRRLRSTLSAMVVAASVLSLGWALGEPPAPADLARHVGREAATVLASTDAVQPQGGEAATVLASTDAVQPQGGRTSRRSPGALAMPYFSFGRRAAAGVP